MHTIRISTFVLVLSIVCLFPTGAEAQSEFRISAWVPYWRSKESVESILPHVSKFTEINPFVYSVKESGALYNNVSFYDDEWVRLKAAAKLNNVAFIPTIMWGGADSIDRILRDPVSRVNHIRAIANEVYAYKLDGIDIDYEGKYAKTRPYFSLFLQELKEAIGYDKTIVCTVESRTPLDSRYSTPESIPDDIEYANDLSEVNKHCDRVNIMAYDQGRIDLKLNDERSDPYVPVADIAWVEKVMRLVAQEVDPSKLSVGVPTYGYEYDMFPSTSGSGQLTYSRLWSFNPKYALETAEKLGLSPVRDAGGELTVTYPAASAPEPPIPLPNATRVMTWSDAGAIEQKIYLAQRLGLAGVAIFKIDGGQDSEIWNVLETAHANAVNAPSEPLAPVTPTSPSSPPTSGTVVSAVVPESNLELDDTGEDVQKLQIFLNNAGFMVSTSGPGSPGNETKVFGYATEAALIRYQKANSINPAVGFFGPVTRAHMRGAAKATTQLVQTFTRDLEEGDTGEDVRSLQKILNSKGFIISESGGGAPGNETTTFGPKTMDALIRFQKANSISPAVGYFGPKTRSALQ